MTDVMQAFSIASNALSMLRTAAGVKSSVDSLAQVAEVQEALINVQGEVLNLQQRALALQDENRALLQRLARSDARERYALTRTAGGAFVFVPKEKGEEPPHYLCPRCLDKEKTQILQGPYQDGSWRCVECETTFQVDPHRDMPALQYDPY